MAILLSQIFSSAFGQANATAPAGPVATEARAVKPVNRVPRYYLREYRVRGAKKLPVIDIQSAVYPFLGPGRTERDIEHARAALEKMYQDSGYQTVSVQVPQQQIKGGVVYLQVVERSVGRVRVTGAKYFSPGKIKAGAPSLAEGTVINFNDVPKDIAALNQNADRQVTPTLKAGSTPDTVDVDLSVKDKDPVHGSLELNNRAGPQTVPLRINGAISDSNLFQLGHTLGFNFQIAPQDYNEVNVFSAYYLAKFSQLEKFSLLLQGAVQNSNISTLGTSAVLGRGNSLGLRGIFALTADNGFSDSISAGFDYKRNQQNIRLTSSGTSSSDGAATTSSNISTPVTYYPFSVNYTADWIKEKSSTTEANIGVTFHFRGMGSDSGAFDRRRYQADGDFIYLRADLSQTRDLPGGFQLYGKVQGQLSNEALLDPEQFTLGGLGTVRGYLEGEEAGDNGIAGSLEFRSPSLFTPIGLKDKGEWRVYVFTDGGWLTVDDTLSGQHDHFYLASYGAGTRAQFADHLSGSLDAGRALTTPTKNSGTQEGDWRLTFRLGLDF